MGKYIAKTHYLLDAIATEIIQAFNDHSPDKMTETHFNAIKEVRGKIEKLNIGKYTAEINDQVTQHIDSAKYLQQQKNMLFERTIFLDASFKVFLKFIKNVKDYETVDYDDPETIVEDFMDKILSTISFIKIAGENIDEVKKKDTVIKKRKDNSSPYRPTLEEMLGKEELAKLVDKLIEFGFATMSKAGSVTWLGNPMNRKGKKGQLVALSYVLRDYYKEAYDDVDRHHAFTTFFRIKISDTMFKDSLQGSVSQYFESYSFLQ